VEQVSAFVARPPARLGAGGAYLPGCDASADKDDVLAGALSLLWSGHLRAHGFTSLESFDPLLAAIKPALSRPDRLEQAFSPALAGGWLAAYLKKTYFADDAHVADASPEMIRALGN